MSQISVFISDDYYQAHLSIKYEEDTAEVEDAINALQDRNVIFGTDLEVITALVNLNEDIYDELIAEGQPHIHGVDAEIIRVHNQREIHPALQDDGTVDFKNLDFLQKVSTGEVLATKIPASEGINGMTVTGKVIQARNGKDLKFKIGENIKNKVIIA